MADIITAINDDPGFCVTVLAAFLAYRNTQIHQ